MVIADNQPARSQTPRMPREGVSMLAELRRPERTFTIRQLCNEFKATPRALRFYEDKGLLTPGREGLNRVYSHKDRARLQLILRGKRVGLSLADIREILELYDKQDGGAAQNAKALRKFRAQLIALEQKREDIDHAIQTLVDSCQRMEAMLAASRPDLLPKAEDYDKVLRARVDGHHELVTASSNRPAVFPEGRPGRSGSARGPGRAACAALPDDRYFER